MPAVLNLSNEVVKMRAEVKRVKVFLIRKLSRQISALQKKKGNEASLEKNGRRAARLREEIRELKAVAPDSVTKAALQKDISFEKVCRDKEASLTDRATARIATHPEFSKKIQSLKAAIKAFKEERMNARKAEKQAKGSAESDTSQDTDDDDDDDEDDEDDEGSEKSNNEDDEDGLKEDEGDKKTDELIDSSSQETLNKQTNQCQEEERLAEEGSSEAVSVPEEVIRMRKEVKRTRVAIISKLAEEVAFLKKKKGEESEVKESQERAAGLLKEIQALRSLKPDRVTMTALQENIELEKILLDNQTSPIDRAIAHIATHSRFINKLQKVKEEKIKAAEAEKKKTDKLDTVQSKKEDQELEEEDEQPEEEDDDDDDDGDDSDKNEEDCNKVGEKSNSVFNQIDKSGDVEPTKSAEPDTFEMPQSKTVVIAPNDQNFPSTALNVQRSEKSSTAPHVQRSPKKSLTASNVQKSPEKSSTTNIVQSSPKKSATASNVQIPPKKSLTTSNIQSSSKKSLTVSSTESKNFVIADKEKNTTLKPQKKQDVPQTKRLEAEKDDEESDLSDDEEEEKEYFDDSTEERFHKQSSQSEDSDDDDFFMGKVSKFKKRKSNQSKVVEKKRELPNPDKEVTSKPRHDSLGKLESVFCSTLSKSNVSSQKAKYRSWNDDQRPPRFQNQRKGPEGRMKASQYKGQDLGSDKRTSSFTCERQTFKAAGQKQAGPSGAGRGKPKFENRHNQNSKGPPGKMSNPPQQSLHPSWEASRKRKEQQGQITAFQGKKIRFDDD